MEKINSSLDRRSFIRCTVGAAAVVTTAGIPRLASAQEPVRPLGAPYKISPLPYGYDALAPLIDTRTMEIHHDLHHAGYINNLNAALVNQPELSDLPLPKLVEALPTIQNEALRTTIRNNAGGHLNHEFFWRILTPAARSGHPSAALAEAIRAQFGTMEAFKTLFNDAAAKRFGSGWAWVIVRPDRTLAITTTANQDSPTMTGIVPEHELGTPILGVDVWEHAYYLNYQNRRAEYLAAFWKIINWQVVSSYFELLLGAQSPPLEQVPPPEPPITAPVPE